MRQKCYVLENGRPVPVDFLTWARWFESATAERVVDQSRVEGPGGEAEVSTVFMGLDYSFGAGPRAILYETLVIGGEFHGGGRRTATLGEAKAAHAAWVEKVKKGKAPGAGEGNEGEVRQ